MPEVLLVRAKPGVLVTDYRALPGRRFIGRGHKPDLDGPGLSLGNLGNGLYDAAKLHKGEPVDVDETFPINSEPHELLFHTEHKHPHIAHEARTMLAQYRKHVAEGALIAHDEETAKACGVKFEVVAKADGTKTEVHGDGSGRAPPDAKIDEHGHVSGESHEAPAEEHAK